MPTDAEVFFMFYILFGCFYSSFNYTFVEEVEMNPNQINETEGLTLLQDTQ